MFGMVGVLWISNMASFTLQNNALVLGFVEQSIRGTMRMWIDKLLWAEGVILGQQQFQQWDAYWQQTLTTHLHTLSPHHWGMLTYAIDQPQLTIGEFTLQQCRAIFPNGVLVHYQAQRQLP
ncbi:MAG: hypothetical protein GKR77_07785, partial [Legionellales bacterium]|nr:hypothetical protein [Legionellales bacterium]